MICPVCEHAGEPLASAQNICLCAKCGLTCALDAAGTAHQATLEDIRRLGDDQMRELRKTRGRIIRRTVK